MNDVDAALLECAINRNPQARAFFLLGFVGSGEEFDSQRLWPTGRPSLTVLCNGCFELSEYSRSDIRREAFHSNIPGQLPAIHTWKIKVRCDQQSCASQREIFYQAKDNSMDKQKMLLHLYGK